MKSRVLGVSVAGVAITVGSWIGVNPSGEFGISRYGVTTFNRIPLPILDLQVRSDGAVRWRAKTHDITADRLKWLTDADPELLIIATGWEGSARVSPDLASRPDRGVLVMRTEEALLAFNALRKRGVRVAVHVHSTC